MNKITTIFIALCATVAPSTIQSAAAASAEGAIKAWIAGAPSDWKISYGKLAYDMASDRTTVTGLKAMSASLKATVGFDTVTITGYAATSDGGFNAAALTADGGVMASTMPGSAKVVLGKVTATDFGAPAITPVAYDPDKPFTSLVRIYGSLLKVHLGHAAVASVSLKGDPSGADFSYTDLAIDNWANGKIASMTTGRMDASFFDKSTGDPVQLSVGGVEYRDTDLDAFVRVYDPSRYVNGVGDQVWRTVASLARYKDIVIDSPEVGVTIGAWTTENIRVRQPAHSFAEFFDTAAKSGGGDKDLKPEEARALFDLMSAFALGKMSITDLEVDSTAGYGSLGAFTISDFSADGIGEIAFDNIDVEVDQGLVKAGRLAVGGIVFPGMDKLAAAFEAAQADHDVDYTGLKAHLGYIEAAGVELDTDTLPMTLLSRLRLDLKDYVGVVPTNIALDIAGFDVPASLFNEAGAGADTLRDLGYDRIRVDYGFTLAWKEADETVSTVHHLTLANAAAITGEVTFSGLSRDDIANVAQLREALNNLKLSKGRVTVQDASLLNRWIAQQAYQQKMNQADFRKQLVAMLPQIVSLIGNDAFQKKLTAALTTYVARPGTLSLAATPPEPMAIGDSYFLAFLPVMIPDVLGLDVSAVAGPEPTPYNYVPRKAARPAGPAGAGPVLQNKP